jgi:hypothetical protein
MSTFGDWNLEVTAGIFGKFVHNYLKSFRTAGHILNLNIRNADMRYQYSAE